jgi:hypothetical protein
MNTVGGPEKEKRNLPLVLVVSAVPVLREALADSLDEIAEVRGIPADRRDTGGLLRWLGPDAVVVDSHSDADEAAEFALESGTPLIRISYEAEKVHVLGSSGWIEPEGAGLAPEDIRNIVVGLLFGRVARGAPVR